MQTVIAVALGGAGGALARYGLDRWIEHHADALFPWATFVINVTGCFAAAIVITVLVDRLGAPTWLGLGASVGFLAAYTTFSTFAYETYELIELRHVALAAVYVAASAVAGVAAIALGAWLGHR